MAGPTGPTAPESARSEHALNGEANIMTARKGPTLSRDGRHRLNLQTTHRVGGTALALMLCRYWASGYGIELGEKIPRATLSAFMRRVLTDHGDNAWSLTEDSWADDHTEAEAQFIATWAVDVVRRAYPDLDDAALAAFLHEFARESA